MPPLGAEDLSSSLTEVIADSTLNIEDLSGATHLYLALAYQAFFEDPDAENIPRVQTTVAGMISGWQAARPGTDPIPVLKDLRALCDQVFLTYQPFLEVVADLAGQLEDSPEEEGAADGAELAPSSPAADQPQVTATTAPAPAPPGNARQQGSIVGW